MELKELLEKAWQDGYISAGYSADQLSSSFNDWWKEEGQELANDYKASLIRPKMEEINEILEELKEAIDNKDRRIKRLRVIIKPQGVTARGKKFSEKVKEAERKKDPSSFRWPF